ncbi:hypothetical protein [Saccharomonospora glauca]|nr:hypothetical protein [Saccharomonospora glauca]
MSTVVIIGTGMVPPNEWQRREHITGVGGHAHHVTAAPTVDAATT